MTTKAAMAASPSRRTIEMRRSRSSSYSEPNAYPAAITPIQGISGYWIMTSGLPAPRIGVSPAWCSTIHSLPPVLGIGEPGPFHAATCTRSSVLCRTIMPMPNTAVARSGR